MSETVILMTIFFILICTIPIVIMVRNNRRTEKALLEKLFSLAKASHDKVTQHDLLDDIAIGLSEISNTLFFISNDHNKNIMEVVPLSEMAKCSLNKPIRRSLDGKDSTIERIELIFTYKDNRKPSKKIDFYDFAHQGFTLHGELQLAEKWFLIIINRLKLSSGNL